jgi:uncharacterized protein YndB with AHSA1/START domain
MAAKPVDALPQGVFGFTRAFKAPRSLVWKAWSEADRLKDWWGPKGCTLDVAGMEFRPGGFFHYNMVFPGNAPMWGRFFYREIAAPDRIVWLNSFSNDGCGISHDPFGIGFPLEVQNTVTFTEQDGATAVALQSVPHGATAEQRAVFDGMFESMQGGFGGTFDQLGDYLAGAQL